MAVAHVAVDLCLGNQRSHGIHYHNVQGSGTNHGFRDLERLLSVVRLGYVQVIHVHTDILRIHRIQRMFRIDKSRNAPALLNLGNHMEGDRGFTAGFRSVDLDHPALGNSSESQRYIETEGTRGNCLYIHLCRRIAQLHDSSLSKLFFNLAKSRIQCF